MEYVLYFVFGYVLAILTWAFYISAMNLIRLRNELKLTKAVQFHAYILFSIGIVLDFLLNWLIATIIFVQLPSFKRPLLTHRLIYNKANCTGWRQRLAFNICAHMLNPFSYPKDHC